MINNEIDNQELQLNYLEEKLFARSPLVPNRGTKKSLLIWMELTLEKLAKLSYEELQDFSESLDKVIDQVRKREEHESDSYVKLVYKLIADNCYAYLREWGTQQTYKSLGSIYLLPFRKYKLVNKKTKEVKVLASLGLWRLEEDKLYLLIQYAYPDNVLREYLFWDNSLRFPALPNAPQQLLGQYFAKKYWEYYCLGEVDNFDELGIDKNALTFVNSSLVKIPQLEISLNTLDSKEQNKVGIEEINIQKEPITIQLLSKHMPDVVEKLRFWQSLSRVLIDPELIKLKTFWNKDNNCFILTSISDQESVHLVILDEAANSLHFPNPQLLWNILLQISAAISKSKNVKEEYKKFVEQLTKISQNKKLTNSKQVLTYLILGDNRQ